MEEDAFSDMLDFDPEEVHSWTNQWPGLYSGNDEAIGMQSSEAPTYPEPVPSQAIQDSTPSSSSLSKRLSTGTKRQHSSDKESGKRSTNGKAKRPQSIPLHQMETWRDPQEESSRGRPSMNYPSSRIDPDRTYAHVAQSPKPLSVGGFAAQNTTPGSPMKTTAFSGERRGLAESRHAHTLASPMPSTSTSAALPQAGVPTIGRGKQARDRARKAQRFHCNEHERDFGSRHDLHRHFLDMHDTWPDGTPIEDIPCPWSDCTKCFRRQRNLSEHIKNKHDGRPPPNTSRHPNRSKAIASQARSPTGPRPLQPPTGPQPFQVRSNNSTTPSAPIPPPDAGESDDAAADLEAVRQLQSWHDQKFDPALIDILTLAYECDRLYEGLKQRRQLQRWLEGERERCAGKFVNEAMLAQISAVNLDEDKRWRLARAQLDGSFRQSSHPATYAAVLTGAAAAPATPAPVMHASTTPSPATSVPAMMRAPTVRGGAGRAGTAGRRV